MSTHLSPFAAAEGTAGGKPGTRYVARQPILTADERVFGYELLFRGGAESLFSATSITSTAASRAILDSSTLLGFDVLCDGRRAFINCTSDILVKDYITLLPAAQTVAEVLHNVPPDRVVTAACQRLKIGGYLLALDDFTPGDPREPLAPLADILKIDMRAVSPADCAAMVKRYKGPRLRLLAKRVETRDEFAAAKQMGFDYFQGYFFRKPELLPAARIPGSQLHYLRMLQAASRPELDPRELESIIKSEPSLCYRLLRYLNSAMFGLSSDVHSVRHAISMLGHNEIRRWARLVAMVAAGQKNKTSDLVLSSLVRARFCELLAPRIKQDDSGLFLLGLLSIMDVILDMPMNRVVDSVALHREIKAVLLGKNSRLQPVYDLMLAQESGNWEKVSALVRELRLDEDEVADFYAKAMQWAREASKK